MIEKRLIGDSGIAVAPFALGGNVFDWTADEAASFAVIDAFVDGGGNMIDTADVYSAWVPGHKGGESEALIGRWLKRNPGKREKVVIATKVGFRAGLAPEIDRRRRATLRSSGWGSRRSTFITSTRTTRTCRWRKSLGAFESLREQRQDPRGRHLEFHRDRGWMKRSRRRGRCGFVPPAALQPWYNMVERERFEGELRDAAIRNGLGVFPYFSLANGFLTGKYRGKADLGKSLRGERSAAYLEGNGMRVLGALDEDRGRDWRRARDDFACLADGPARGHRADRQRDQRRSARGADRGDAPDAEPRPDRPPRRGERGGGAGLDADLHLWRRTGSAVRARFDRYFFAVRRSVSSM